MRLISPLTMHSSNFLPFSLLQWVFFQTSVLLHFHIQGCFYSQWHLINISVDMFPSIWQRVTFHIFPLINISPLIQFLKESLRSGIFCCPQLCTFFNLIQFLFSSQNCLLLIEKLSMYQHVWLPGGEWWAPPSIMVLHNGPAGIPTLWDTRGIPL